MALRHKRSPSLVLTDSLNSLQLIQAWGHRSIGTVLACPERAVVRQFLHCWAGVSAAPVLEKVSAHDGAAAARGCIKAKGNVDVDLSAKKAAAGCVIVGFDRVSKVFSNF